MSSDCKPEQHSTIYVADMTSSELPKEPTLLGKGIGLLDFAPDTHAIVFDTLTPSDQSNGLWVVRIGDQSPPQKIADDGMQPLWRPCC